LKAAYLAYIFVTHVHLDHAGGAGHLAAAHPEATIVCHPRAARHLADPRRLIESVPAASPNLFPLYGEPIPIPEERIHPAEDGEVFQLGDGIALHVVHSPGHAPHHTCFFESSHRVLFAGDAVGSYDTSIPCPLTVPPRYDVAAGSTTLSRLARLRSQRIAFTHFGIAGNPVARIEAYASAVVRWLESIDQLRNSGLPDDAVVSRVLKNPAFSRVDAIGRDQIAVCARGALATLAEQ